MRQAAAGAVGVAFLLLPINGSSAVAPAATARIVFAGVHAHDALELFSMRSDGSSVRRVSFAAPSPSDPAWSPDGRKIAYEADPEAGQTGIWITGSSGFPLRQLSRHGRDPAWAPNGKSVAFVYRHQLVVVHADGSHRHTVFRGRSRLASPSWSPDGTKLVFARPARPGARSNEGAIYLISADGTDARRIAAGAEPAWSPGGRRIAFARRIVVPPGVRRYDSVWVMNDDGSGAHELPLNYGGEGLRAHQPAWSPDGSRLAVTAPFGVAIVKADGSVSAQRLCSVGGGGDKDPAWSPDSTRIVASGIGTLVLGRPGDGSCTTFLNGSGDSDPTPSPDGTNLAFVRYGGLTSATFVRERGSRRAHKLTRYLNPSWSPDGSKLAVDDSDAQTHRNVLVLDLATKTVTPIPGTDGGIQPDWSPRGTSIVFVGPSGLSVTTTDGTKMRVLVSPLPGFFDREPAWSPDGRRIAFSRTPICHGLVCRTSILVVPATGGLPRRLASNAGSPAWSPDGQRLAFVRAKDIGIEEIWVMDADGSHQRRLTRHRFDADPAWQPAPR